MVPGRTAEVSPLPPLPSPSSTFPLSSLSLSPLSPSPPSPSPPSPLSPPSPPPPPPSPPLPPSSLLSSLDSLHLVARITGKFSDWAIFGHKNIRLLNFVVLFSSLLHTRKCSVIGRCSMLDKVCFFYFHCRRVSTKKFINNKIAWV